MLTGTGYAVFPIDVDRLPDGAGPLRFHVIQTPAADGRVVRPRAYGAPPAAPRARRAVQRYSDRPAGRRGTTWAVDVRVPERTRSPWWTVARRRRVG
jgi:hypothetical protein